MWVIVCMLPRDQHHSGCLLYKTPGSQPEPRQGIAVRAAKIASVRPCLGVVCGLLQLACGTRALPTRKSHTLGRMSHYPPPGRGPGLGQPPKPEVRQCPAPSATVVRRWCGGATVVRWCDGGGVVRWCDGGAGPRTALTGTGLLRLKWHPGGTGVHAVPAVRARRYPVFPGDFPPANINAPFQESPHQSPFWWQISMSQSAPGA